MAGYHYIMPLLVELFWHWQSQAVFPVLAPGDQGSILSEVIRLFLQQHRGRSIITSRSDRNSAWGVTSDTDQICWIQETYLETNADTNKMLLLPNLCSVFNILDVKIFISVPCSHLVDVPINMFNVISLSLFFVATLVFLCKKIILRIFLAFAHHVLFTTPSAQKTCDQAWSCQQVHATGLDNSDWITL